MGTSSEDVLLMVSHVRHKKNDGTLYLMNERIAWMLEDKDTFSISHKYADIKMQKISPDGKAKIQLQVVLHNGDTTTFHFVNPIGQEAQLQDRNGVKELLQQLLPKFKRKVNKELEEKNRILQEDPELFQLYKDLVMSQIITAEEFWSNYALQRQANAKQALKQEVGVSAAFLADISPQTDGCNGMKYNLTVDIIESIFRTYPAVKKKHMENVPHKLSENEFWTKFFQSHYFHRDRLSGGNNKDFFSECAKSDEQDIKRALQNGIKDQFADITSFDDKSLEEGYGSTCSDITTKNSGASAANQAMIRRFNHHSIMVLEACQSQKPPDLPNGSATETVNSHMKPGMINGAAVSNTSPATGQKNDKQRDQQHLNDEDEERVAKKAKLNEKLHFEDLENNSSTTSASLRLTKLDRYHFGPTPATDTNYASHEEILEAVHCLRSAFDFWEPNLPQVLSSAAAISALGELSPGGALLKSSQQVPLKDTVPVEIQQEMKQVYTAFCELLRHFWSCFPTTTPQLEEKVVKMRDTLERFQYAKLQPFQDKLLRNHCSADLAAHLGDMLQAAYNKFSTWQARRLSLSRK